MDGRLWTAGLSVDSPKGWVLVRPDGAATRGDRVRLWHPIRAAISDVQAWRAHLMDAGRRQPWLDSAQCAGVQRVPGPALRHKLATPTHVQGAGTAHPAMPNRTRHQRRGPSGRHPGRPTRRTGASAGRPVRGSGRRSASGWRRIRTPPTSRCGRTGPGEVGAGWPWSRVGRSRRGRALRRNSRRPRSPAWAEQRQHDTPERDAERLLATR
jgi:hypothetical protein